MVRHDYDRPRGHTGFQRNWPPPRAVAVAHSLLIVLYIMLMTGKPYVELGGGYFVQLDAAVLNATVFAASSHSGTPPR